MKNNVKIVLYHDIFVLFLKNLLLHSTVCVSKIRWSTLKCQNTPLKWAETKIDDSILLPVKSSYIFW